MIKIKNNHLLGRGGKGTYRVSHVTLQLVNSFECLLPYAVYDTQDFLLFILLKTILY